MSGRALLSLPSLLQSSQAPGEVVNKLTGVYSNLKYSPKVPRVGVSREAEERFGFGHTKSGLVVTYQQGIHNAI